MFLPLNLIIAIFFWSFAKLLSLRFGVSFSVAVVYICQSLALSLTLIIAPFLEFC